MISITLTGDEATKYLSHIDAIDSAYDTIAELQSEIVQLQATISKHERSLPHYEQKSISSKPEVPSALTQHLAEQKAKQASLDHKPACGIGVAMAPPGILVTPASGDLQRSSTIITTPIPPKWTEADIRQLKSFPEGPPSKRTLEHTLKVFPDRSESAIRTKLNSLGIRVKAGILVWKK